MVNFGTGAPRAGAPRWLRACLCLWLSHAWLAMPAGAAQGCREITLPADEDRAERRFSMQESVRQWKNLGGREFSLTDSHEIWDTYYPQTNFNGCVEFRVENGTSRLDWVEIAMALAHPHPAMRNVELGVGTRDGVGEIGRFYREILPPGTTDGRYRHLSVWLRDAPAGVKLNDLTGFDPNDPDYKMELPLDQGMEELELVVIMQRVRHCSVSAWVSGDADGHFVGDIAFFNALDREVKTGMAVGSLGDPESHKAMQGFIDGMAGLARWAEEQGYDTGVDRRYLEQDGPTASESGPGDEFTAFLEEALAPDNPGEGDNFGLNLTDVTYGQARETSKQGAMKMLSGAFTLTVSGRRDRAATSEEINLTAVQPSTVTATVGLGDEGSSIRFDKVDGVELVVSAVSEDFILGTIDAALSTRGAYTIPGVAHGRPLKVVIKAHFGARRGAFGCMR